MSLNQTNQDVLILTATITPPQGAVQLSRVDPMLRLRDYHDALDFYLACLNAGFISGIVFADNSASDVTLLRNLVRDRGAEKKVEILSFNGLDHSPAFGRGYGEFKLIDFVVDRSSILQKVSKDAPIWKVTGRYVLRNFESIIRSRPREVDIYCHCRNIPKHWTDLYILSWNMRGYGLLLKGIYEHLNEEMNGCSAEHTFRRIVDQNAQNCRIMKRFRVVPRLEGIRGLDNRRYEEMSMRLYFRQIANSIAPWLWI